MRNYVTAFKHYNLPTNKELIEMGFTAFFAGLIFSFDKWGVENVDIGMGVSHLLTKAIIAFFLLFIMDFSRRLWAMKYGYQVTYKIWWVGIMISLFLVFYTNGMLKFILPGGFTCVALNHMRLHYFPPGAMTRDIARVAMAGIFAAVAFTVIGYLFLPWDIVVMCMVIIIAGLVPLDIAIRPMDKGTPISPGSAILFGSRALFVMTLVFILVALLLMKVAPFWLTIIVAFLAACIGCLVYFWHKEL